MMFCTSARTGYGLLMAGSGVGALARSADGRECRAHLFRHAMIALGGVWIFSVALAFSPSPAISISRLFCSRIVGFGIVLYFSTSNTVLQSIVPDEMRGRVMGIWALIFGGMIPLGSLEAGFMADFLGRPRPLPLARSICALAAFITLEVIRRREARNGVILTNR